MLPWDNFEFLDFERYFTYFRTRFEKKLQPQKAIFKLPNVVRSKKNCKILYCTHKYNSKIARCLRFCKKKNEAHLATRFEF